MTPASAQSLIDEFVSDTELQLMVAEALNYCAALSAAVAFTHGFHDDENELLTYVARTETAPNQLAAWTRVQLLQAEIARVGEELGEAIDNIRHDSPPDDKCPQFPGWHVELGADVLIRVFDTLGKRGVSPGEIFVAKTLVNNARAHKHGKNS
jgi:hypothetical protein